MTDSSKQVFLSHASADKPFALQLRVKLEQHGFTPWVDAREMTGGDGLPAAIKKAIEGSAAMLVVLSPNTINSTWVTREVKFALKQRKERPDFKIVPLLLPGMDFSSLPHWFGNEPLAVKVTIGPGGIETAMPDILAALGARLPTYRQAQSIQREPVAELLLTLTDPAIIEADGKRRATANATLTYRPSDTAVRDVASRRFKLTAPLGPIEAGEMKWYLESYWRWPVSVYKDRAEAVEKVLPEWGNALYKEIKREATEGVFTGWNADKAGERRFTVEVNADLPEGSPVDAGAAANEASTALLSLPWELLHDGRAYLFEGPRGVRVRRTLPNHDSLERLPEGSPLRVLLISPRPEDAKAGYLDHRASARPLVEALAPLGDLVELTLLTPGIFSELRKALREASEAGRPYHVVHFDGHGVYDPKVGLGALCFEDPDDREKPEKRRSVTVDAGVIGDMMRHYRVPLVFLDACQTALADADPTASVAGKLLESGVASVVAMSHSVLVETARRFVTAFYGALALGERVGQAMLAGQRALKDDARRLKTFVGDLSLQDWFVPVLYQEERDPQLINQVHDAEARAGIANSRKASFGLLPETPPQTFVGRSRELLMAERLLERSRHITIRGEGGEGKTTLAVELARWLVQTNRFERAAFVSLENSLPGLALSLIGQQLVPNYLSIAGQGENRGPLAVDRALGDHSTIIVFDNLESILPPAAGATNAAAYNSDILDDLLALCKHLLTIGNTHIVFTSRETLPPPYDRPTIPLGRLSKTDAVDLVARTLDGQWMPGASDAATNDEEIEKLVEAAGCHARALVLLTGEITRTGVKNATANMAALMQSMAERHPDSRERSLYASVELSLRRLPDGVRELIRPLGVFQGDGSLTLIRVVLQISEQEVFSLSDQLVGVGLAALEDGVYLRFDPALCPLLLSEMTAKEQAAARETWANAAAGLADFLYQHLFSNTQDVLNLARHELSNLLSALELYAQSRTPEEVIDFATNVESLAQSLGRKKAVEWAERIRWTAAGQLSDWSHASYLAADAAVDRLLDAGRIAEAVVSAERLLARCLAAGEDAYRAAGYDVAMAHFKIGRAHRMARVNDAAIRELVEAERRFHNMAESGNAVAARMASVANTDRADCLRDLGRLDEAADVYVKLIVLDDRSGQTRDAAVDRMQLATVRMLQDRLVEAINLHHEAKDAFERLEEPAMVAVAWHQIGMVYRVGGEYSSSEHAYQQSLQLNQSVGNRAGQAPTLCELGNLYYLMDRYEDAVRFYHEAAVICVEQGDLAMEGFAHSNAALVLILLEQFDEARRELLRAIECDKPSGHSAEPWKTFGLLHKLETAVDDAAAAQDARAKAIAAYLAYRRDGGQIPYPDIEEWLKE